MKENVATALTILGTVLFFGLVNPEVLLSDDTVSVQDEEGNSIERFSKLPGSAMTKIEQLLEKISAGDDSVEYQFRIMRLLDQKDTEKNIDGALHDKRSTDFDKGITIW